MILIAGQDGIVSMKNEHTGTRRDMLILNNQTNLNGPISMVGNTIELGYNETIIMKDSEAAVILLHQIDSAINDIFITSLTKRTTNKQENTMKELDLSKLKLLYPKTKNNQATTGTIPISFYYAHEKEISKICVEQRLQRFYRGPRWKDTATRTRKADATGVVLYRKL